MNVTIFMKTFENEVINSYQNTKKDEKNRMDTKLYLW